MKTSIDKYLSWHLAIGLLLFVMMTAVLAEISDQVTDGEPLTQTDVQLTQWLHVNRTTARVTAFSYATYLGSTVFATCISALAALYLFWRRKYYWFATLVLSVVGGVIVNRLLKAAFQRTRPQFDDPIFTFTGYSFPSGHTLISTVLYGCLAAIIVANIHNRSLRILVIVLAAFLIALVGFSRIYLGAHYLTDVLAAMAEGLAWLSLSFTFVYSVWRHKHAVAAPPKL